MEPWLHDDRTASGTDRDPCRALGHPRRRIPNCDEEGVVRGVEDVSTSSGAERENRRGVWPAYGRWKTGCCVGCAGGCVSWGSGPTAAASSPPFGMFSTPSWVDSVV